MNNAVGGAGRQPRGHFIRLGGNHGEMVFGGKRTYYAERRRSERCPCHVTRPWKETRRPQSSQTSRNLRGIPRRR